MIDLAMTHLFHHSCRSSLQPWSWTCTHTCPACDQVICSFNFNSDYGINHFMMGSKVPYICVHIDYAPTLRFHLCNKLSTTSAQAYTNTMQWKWSGKRIIHKGRLPLPKRMNFRKSSKGGGVILNPKNYVAKFCHYRRYFGHEFRNFSENVSGIP